MAARLISYNLRKSGRDYKDLQREIMALGVWWQSLEAVWIVESDRSCADIKTHLQKFVEPTDDLLVLALEGSWSSVGLTDQCNNWLASVLGPKQE